MRLRRCMASAIATMKADFQMGGDKMKTISMAMAVTLISACGGATDIVDPYADLAEETTLVQFEANPDLEDGMCNPNVHYALRTEEEYIFVNVNYAVGDNITGSGINLANLEQSGIATTDAELNMFDPYEVPCSELHVKVTALSCRLEDENDGSPCPSPQFEGTDMFASFRGLPDY